MLAKAQQAAPSPEAWYKAVTVNAFAEASYSYNFNRPGSDLDALRVFDYNNGKPALDVAEIVVQRPVSKSGEFGFRFDATAGESVPRVTASYGLFRDRSTGEAHNYDLHQIFVSWIAPLGKGLRLDAGKFVTPFGYEVIEGYDGYNDNQTRSLLFGYAIPFTHTGLRASYAFSEKFSATAMAVQGWDDWHDNNGAKSAGMQLAFTPTKGFSVYVTAMGGPERTDDNRDNRYNYEAVSVFKPTDRLTLGLDVVTGNEEGFPIRGMSARWSGVAGYLRYNFTERFAMAFRAELFDDAEGARTGTPQTLKEVTLTPEFKLGKHFVVRGDLRHDWSSADVFQNRAAPVSGQTTAIVAVLFIY